jgi:hypothetical protein
MSAIAFGRLLRAGTTGFVVGCRVAAPETPVFGALVRVPQPAETQVYGLVYDIHIDDDGLVRQLATTSEIDAAVIADNRTNRNVPIEMSVLAVGYEQDGEIRHLLPPRPPLSLDQIYVCSPENLCRFTAQGRFGYLRHVLRATDLPVAELLATHLEQAAQAHRQVGEQDWLGRATRELITVLRDDYPLLQQVLSALADIQVANRHA